MYFVMPNGQVYTYLNVSADALRYGLAKPSGQLLRIAYEEEVLPGLSLSTVLWHCYEIQQAEEAGAVSGALGRFSRDLAYISTLIAIKEYGYRLYQAVDGNAIKIPPEDTTVEWLQKSLDYLMPPKHRLLAELVLAELVADEL